MTSTGQDLVQTLKRIEKKVEGFVSILEYEHLKVAIGNGWDWAPAIQACADDFKKQGIIGTINFPNGTYDFYSPIYLTNVSLIGESRLGTILNCRKQLGVGVSSIVIEKSVAYGSRISKLSLKYHGYIRSLGKRSSNTDGLRMKEAGIIDDISISGFDSGFIFDSVGGHISILNSNISNNYYGIYYVREGGDFYIADSNINGNIFANMAIPGDIQLSAATVFRTHFGFAPYGIFQEYNSSPRGFLIEVNLIDTRFEAIGNAAIFTENTKSQNNVNAGQCANINIDRPGFSWLQSYRIKQRTRNYAIEIGRTTGRLYYNSGDYPFSNGDKGSWYIYNNYAICEMKMRAIEKIDVEIGRKDFFNIYQANNPTRGSSNIPAGSKERTITVNSIGFIESLKPIVTATNTGALNSPFTLFVDTLVQSEDKKTHSFTVRILGDTPKTNLTFNWSLGY